MGKTTKEDIISGRRRRKKSTEPNVETRNVMLDEVVVTAPNKQKNNGLDLDVVETQPYQGGKIAKEATPVVSMPTANNEDGMGVSKEVRPEQAKTVQTRRNPFEGFGEGLAKVASVLDFNRDERGARAYERANERIANREHRAAVRRQKDEVRAGVRDARQAERLAVRQARAEDRAEAMAERQAVRQNRIDERAAEDALRQAEAAERKAASIARRNENKSLREEARMLRAEQAEARRTERAENRIAVRNERADERLARQEQRGTERDARLADKADRKEARLQERAIRQAEHDEAVQMRREARGLERAAKELERLEHRDARIADKEARREERQAGRDSRKQERADRYTDKQRERMFDDVFGAELDGKRDKMPKSAVHKDVPIIDSTLEEEEALPKPTPRELKMAGIPQGVQTEAYKDKIDEDVSMYVPTPERAKKAQEYAKNIKMAGIDVDEDAKKAPELDNKIEPIPSSLSKWDSVLPEVVVDGKRTKQPTKEESDAKRAAYADKMQSIVAPYLMGSQATEETIKKGHSIYDIEKENQAKREQEKIDEYTDAQRERIFREAFKEESKKTAAPVVDENVPVIDSTLENEEPLPVPEKKEGADKAATVSQRTEQEGGAGESSQQPPKVNSVGSMMDYVDKMAKSMPTKEQLEKERKRRKAAAVLAAIGDGVSAWANLQATVGGAPSVKHTANLSTAMKERYDKLKEEREKKAKEILEYRMRALASDRQQANADRNFEEGVRRYDTNRQDNLALREQQQKNWETTRQDGIDQRNQAQENWQKTFDANEAHRKAQTEIQNKNAETQKKRAEAYAEQQANRQASTLRGKKIGFSDGDKNEVAIYENVWKGSMQSVYDAMIKDALETGVLKQPKSGDPTKPLTAQQKEDWVKQHWTKSPRARAIMLALSEIDPAAVLSQVEDDESFEEYAEMEDDFEQYVEE